MKRRGDLAARSIRLAQGLVNRGFIGEYGGTIPAALGMRLCARREGRPCIFNPLRWASVMFNLFGVQGRVPAPTVEDVRRLSPVIAAERIRRIIRVEREPHMPPASGTTTAGGHGGASAYAAIAGEGAREPLKIVQDVMHQPVVSVPIDASVGEAWQELLRHGVGQAPVVDLAGRLVGLIGRAELLPVPALISRMAKASSLQALLTKPVATVMWSPVPAAQPDTELRRVAALLLATGLPGVPVADSNGHLIAFVSRSDLLQAMVTDPPLDLWG